MRGLLDRMCEAIFGGPSAVFGLGIASLRAVNARQARSGRTDAASAPSALETVETGIFRSDERGFFERISGVLRSWHGREASNDRLFWSACTNKERAVRDRAHSKWQIEHTPVVTAALLSVEARQLALSELNPFFVRSLQEPDPPDRCG
jgi:hypothetical protein